MLKTALLLSVALGAVFVLAAAALWFLLDSAGVFTALNHQIGTIGSGRTRIDIDRWLDLPRTLAIASGVAVLNTLVITIGATLSASLHNLASSLVGGLNLTLTSD